MISMKDTIHAFASRAVSARSRATCSDSQNRRQAYTLIELMVVITIIVISMAIIIPSINRFMEMVTDNTAKNGINTALTAIRAYATRSIGDDLNLNGSTYAGVAIIVTPACELRLAESDQFAQDVAVGHAYLDPTMTRKGYRDISDREYITLPKDTGIVGIYTPTVPTKYIAPPFAIRFDKTGQLAVTNSSDSKSYVYYDGNCDGYITINTVDGYARDKPFDGLDQYKVQQWDPSEQAYFDLLGSTPPENTVADKPGKYAPSNDADENYGKYKLPFEKLEAVIGIVIYSKRALMEDTASAGWPGTSGGTDWPTGFISGCDTNNDGKLDDPCGDFEDWLKNHGEVLFFSRYTGALIQHK